MTPPQTPDPNLISTVEKLSSLIQSYESRPGVVNESNTIRALITPMIEALGWPIHDLDEVQSEYRHKTSDNPVDYALFIDGTPCLFVEAKALDKDLDDRKWIVQTLNYANACAVEWAALTNGREWRVYNVHHKAEAEEKLFYSVDITGDPDKVAQRLSMLARERMAPTRALDKLWREASIDAVMRRLIDELPENRSAVRAMAKASDGKLTDAEVRNALRRLKLRADWRGDGDLFPVSSAEEATTAASTPDPLFEDAEPAPSVAASPPSAGQSAQRKTARTDVRVPQMIELGLLQPGQTLRLRNKAGSDAVLVDGKTVKYQGEKMTFQKWANAVTGWKAIQIYAHAETEDGELLQEIRERAPE